MPEGIGASSSPEPAARELRARRISLFIKEVAAMSKSKSVLLMVLALAVLMGGPAVGAAADKKVVIKLSDQVNEQNPHFKAHEFFAKTVAEKSGGSIEVKIFPNSQLGSAREGLEGVLSGTIQAVKVTSGELSTYSPKFLVFSLPYMFTNKREVFAALDGKLGAILTAELEKQGFKLVAFFDTGFRSVFNQKRPITTVADMKGLKIRVINDPVMIETINTLGALATPLPYGELYTALKQGVVDGAEQPPVALYTMKFYEVSKYFSLTNHFYDLNLVVMSKALFDRTLSPAQQKAVLEAGKATEQFERKLWNDYEQDVIAKIRATGMQVNELDLAPFKQAVAGIVEKNKARVGPDVIEAALSYAGK
jgi:tripartite ATP-independent transporter DctP family solute receptor